MPLPPNPHSRPGPGWTFPVLALVVGVLGAAAAWSVVYLWLRGPAAWMGLLAAADMALMLRLAAAPPGRGRAVLATIGTASAIAIGLWMVAATQMAIAAAVPSVASAARARPGGAAASRSIRAMSAAATGAIQAAVPRSHRKTPTQTAAAPSTPTASDSTGKVHDGPGRECGVGGKGIFPGQAG